MNILLLGSGGREHAFAWKLAQSPDVKKLFIAPGNAGTALCGENVNLNLKDFESVYRFAAENQIQLVLPGNEDPLVDGITDFFAEQNKYTGLNILVAGPSHWCAQLEGSKDFSKAFMNRHNIPTAASFTATEENLTDGLQFLTTLNPPYVLKADGLAAGKGVIITSDLEEAKSTLSEMILNRTFGDASATVVIEEYLHGIEISVFAISDGDTWQFLASAKDYKRIGEGDTGPNTGGMGAISPVPFADEVFMQKVRDRIAEPTFSGLKAEGHPYRGFLFIGLMNCNGDPYVIEYNVRMGDPETEAIFPRLKTDMAKMIKSMATGNLKDLTIELDSKTAATVFLVSAGYPGTVEKGKAIQLPEVENNSVILYAGVKNNNGTLETNGGRVLAVTSLAESISDAVAGSMKVAASIQFEGKNYRKDIGRDLLSANA